MTVAGGLDRARGDGPADRPPDTPASAGSDRPDEPTQFLWLVRRGFSGEQARRLVHLRRAVRRGERGEGRDPGHARLEFARWLVQTGRLREGT